MTGISVLVNICLNLILIPRYSYIGASISTVVSGFLIVILVVQACLKMNYEILNLVFIKTVIKIGLSAVVMGLFITVFSNINFFILILLSVLIYFLALSFFRGFDKTDLFVFRKAIKRE